MNPRDPKGGKSGGSGVRPSPPEKDWKLPDPTQRKQESRTVDISKVSRQTQQDELSRIMLLVAIFLVCLVLVAVAAYISIHPDSISFAPQGPSVTRVPVDWATDSRAVDAFSREETNALKLSSEELGSFAQRYWELEESKKNVVAIDGHSDADTQQASLWKDLKKGKDVLAIQVRASDFRKTVGDAESERYQIGAARSERDLPDGGLREIGVSFLTKIPDRVLSTERITEMAAVSRPMVLLLAPYFIESSSESTTKRATELRHDANRSFAPMNNWVSFVIAKLAIHADLIGVRLLETPEYKEEVHFKVVVGDEAAPVAPPPAAN